jgi:competence protein ComEC
MFNSVLRSTALLGLLVVLVHTAAAQSRNLDIYWIDTEGGGATLVVSPTGESLLVDTGWEVGDRDANRIVAVAAQAGLKKIDYLIITHFHTDHVGGLRALAKMMPIENCVDHGGSIEPENQKWLDAYLSVCSGKRMAAKAGEKIPLNGIQVDVIASNGQLLAAPINGGGPNPLCAGAEQKPQDSPENQRSVGVLVTYARFRFLDLGDLNWAKEMELACPVNKVGEVTLYQTSRHGAFDGAGAPAHLYALRPQVVVVNNGPRKGLAGTSPGLPKVMSAHYERIAKSPGIEGIWQQHLALLDKEHNTEENMIANLGETAECKGHWLRTSVRPDGTFTVTNSRNGFSRSYKAR